MTNSTNVANLILQVIIIVYLLQSELYEIIFTDSDSFATSYHKTLSTILDKEAPLKSQTITVRPLAPWYNEEIQQARKERWIAEGLSVQHEIYKEERNKLHYAIRTAKAYYSQKAINDSDLNQKALYSCLDNILGKRKTIKLPTFDSSENLANEMTDYFDNKVKIIIDGLKLVQ